MKKATLAMMLLCCLGWLNAAFPVKIDVGTTNASGIEPGWQPFTSTDNGSTVYDGLKFTFTSTGAALGYRYRTSTDLNGILNEMLWRDFVFAGSDTDINLLIDGLAPNTLYEISIGAFDYDSRTNTPRAADWKVNGQTILTTSFGIPGVPIATLLPSAEHNYMMSGLAYSDANGTIELQSARAGGGTAHAFVNGVIVDQPIWAYDPTPANESVNVPVDALLSWSTGPDPNNMSQPNPKIRMHYLYFSEDPNFAGLAPIEIAAGNPVGATGSYDPVLAMDKTYYWRVDEAVDNGSGGYTAPGDPYTIRGKVWTFDTVKSFATIGAQPVSVKAATDETAILTVDYSSFSSAAVSWMKDGEAVIPDSRRTIVTTASQSTLTIAHVSAADEGGYWCVITNQAGPVTSDTAYLMTKKVLAHYMFEYDGSDAVGANAATPVNGMSYAAGIVTAGAQTAAADPNGSSYYLVPAETAYPRAGFGNGLEESTYAMWINPGGYTGYGRLFGTFNDGNNTAIQINITGEGAVGFYLRQEGNIVREFNASELVKHGEWQHLVLTYDGRQQKIYVNGKLQATSAENNPLWDLAGWQYPMAIFARNVRGVINEFYKGQADDFRIYNYALDKEDVARLYYDVTGERPCIYAVSEFDFTGDCVVDFDDFAVFAASWLESGLFVP